MKNGYSSYIPVYNFQKGVHTGERLVKPVPIIIFEGLFAAYGDIPKIADYIVYVESPLYARVMRRIIRNSYERYNVDSAYTFKGIFKVTKAHNALVVKQKAVASCIVQVPFSFQNSIDQFNLEPIDIEWQRLNEAFSFNISNHDYIKVLESNRVLRFVYLYQNKVFINFPISPEMLRMMNTLDFNSW